MDVNNKAEASGSASPVWNRDLVLVFALHLPPNVVACTLRLVSKETAKWLLAYKTVNLSALVPEHAFAHRFSSTVPLRQFSSNMHIRLLALTAASGGLPNLQLLLRAIGWYLTGEVVPADAPGCLLWRVMQQHGRYSEDQLQELMDAAAFAGHGEVCRWLLASGCPVARAVAAVAAARGGHLGLMEELRASSEVEVRGTDLVCAAAEGCSLPDLIQLYRQELQGQERSLGLAYIDSILASAASSPSADWQSKLTWLEERWQWRTDVSDMPDATNRVVGSRLADSAERLAWLRGREYLMGDKACHLAANAGNMPALTYLLDTLGAPPDNTVATAAAEGGHLAALQLLHARGWPTNTVSALREAMGHGHLPVVSWLVEAFGVGDEQLRGLTPTAVRSCSLPLLRWLHERGCFQAGGWLIQVALACGCSEEMLEWLVEHDCTVDIQRVTLDRWVTLRCLERLGWRPTEEELKRVAEMFARRPLSGPTLRWLRDRGALPPATQGTFVDWIRRGYSLCSLQWLAEEARGLLDWRAALQAAVGMVRWQQDKEVVEWIRGRL